MKIILRTEQENKILSRLMAAPGSAELWATQTLPAFFSTHINGSPWTKRSNDWEWVRQWNNSMMSTHGPIMVWREGEKGQVRNASIVRVSVVDVEGYQKLLSTLNLFHRIGGTDLFIELDVGGYGIMPAEPLFYQHELFWPMWLSVAAFKTVQVKNENDDRLSRVVNPLMSELGLDPPMSVWHWFFDAVTAAEAYLQHYFKVAKLLDDQAVEQLDEEAAALRDDEVLQKCCVHARDLWQYTKLGGFLKAMGHA